MWKARVGVALFCSGDMRALMVRSAGGEGSKASRIEQALPFLGVGTNSGSQGSVPMD